MPIDSDPAAHDFILDVSQAAALKSACGGEVQKYVDGEVSGLKFVSGQLPEGLRVR